MLGVLFLYILLNLLTKPLCSVCIVVCLKIYHFDLSTVLVCCSHDHFTQEALEHQLKNRDVVHVLFAFQLSPCASNGARHFTMLSASNQYYKQYVASVQHQHFNTRQLQNLPQFLEMFKKNILKWGRLQIYNNCLKVDYSYGSYKSSNRY